MPTIRKLRWNRLIPALAAALLLAAPPALAHSHAPTLTSVTEADGEVTVTWTYEDDNVVGFKLRQRQNDGDWDSLGGSLIDDGTARSHKVSNIEPGNVPIRSRFGPVYSILTRTQARYLSA